jgi:hypothetical protein
MFNFLVEEQFVRGHRNRYSRNIRALAQMEIRGYGRQISETYRACG